MTRKQDHTDLYYLFGINKGVWILILVHLFILVALIFSFSSLIAHMSGY